MKNQVLLFGTRNDVEGNLSNAEARLGVTYVVNRCYHNEPVTQFERAAEIPGFWETYGEQYLIFANLGEMAFMELPKGSSRLYLDMLHSQSFVTFLLPHVTVRDGMQYVLRGELARGAADAGSRALYTRFKKELVREWRKIHYAYVGPEAASMMKQGARLTWDIGVSAEYDLRE
jgi:hypothetical protein